MIYPQFLKKGDRIGVVSPSFGISGYKYEVRFEAAYEKMKKKGYDIQLCPSIRKLSHARSGSGETRANELMEMFETTDFVWSVAGGELMMEMLPYLDFDRLQRNPKFFMGTSDNTNLAFVLTTKCDIASIYGPCFSSFGMKRWHESLKDSYQVACGEKTQLYSYPKYEVDAKDGLDPLCGYNLKCKTEYRSLSGHDEVISGRLIGGCLDILVMLCGTRFDYMKQFAQRYQDEGILFYCEACDLNVLSITRGLWQLKNAGWFEHCNGIIIGRPRHPESVFDVDVTEAVSTLADLGIPVVYDCDFGHVAPGWAMVNGAFATFEYHDGKGSIHYEYK